MSIYPQRVESSTGCELAVAKQTDYDMLDCVMVECTTKGCQQIGKPTSVDVFSDKKHRVLLLTPHKDVMCEHVWNRMKLELDRRLDEYREQEGFSRPEQGTTVTIG